jgi:hypothetical protein
MNVDGKKRLSVYWLSDDKHGEDLSNTIAALAIQRGSCEQFDYALIDEQAVVDLGLLILETAGDTLDDEVNSRHRDIADGGVEKLAMLTTKFVPQPAIKPKAVAELVAGIVNAGKVDYARLSLSVARTLAADGLCIPVDHDAARCDQAAANCQLALEGWSQAVSAYADALKISDNDDTDALRENLAHLESEAQKVIENLRLEWIGHTPHP